MTPDELESEIEKLKNFGKKITLGGDLSEFTRTQEEIHGPKIPSVPYPPTTLDISLVLIRKVRLDEKEHFLEVNGGEKIVPFNSKRKEKGVYNETKLFNILFHLWDYRWEVGKGRVQQKGSWVAIHNLTKQSECLNDDSTYQHIKRLNSLFRKEKLKIVIEGQNGKYRLLIYKY